MRTRQTFVLHLLADPEEPRTLRGLIHTVASGEEQSFSGDPALLAFLHRMVSAALDHISDFDAEEEVKER